MNCQDITRMLDEQRIDELPVAEHQAALVHLAGCTACTRDWHVHRLLVSEAIPPVPPELRVQFLLGQAGTPAARARRQSRFILIGTLFVVAAAAAVFTMQVMDTPIADGYAVSAAVTEAPERPLVERISLEQVVVESEPEPQPIIEADPAAAPATAAVPGNARFVLLLMPTRHESPQDSARPVIESFQAALVRAFRNEPDFAVVQAVGGRAPEGVNATHRLTVVSPRYTELSDGSRVYQRVDGSSGSTGVPPAEQGQSWAADVMLESVAEGSVRRLIVWPMLGKHGIPIRGAGCGVGGFSRSGPDLFRELIRACESAEGIAFLLARALRSPPEPVTDAVSQQLARLRDASVRPVERQSALSQLLIQARTSGTVLDAAVADVAMQLLREQSPDQRIQIINLLRLSNQPAFIELLTESLRRDASESVRLAALATLAASYGSDDRVRSAFAAVAQQDASQLVRMGARHQLPGDTSWQPYVLATLANTQLPPADRAAPILLAARLVTGPPGEAPVMDLLRADGVLSLLGDVVKALHAESAVAGPGAGTSFPGEGPLGGAIQNILQLIGRRDQAATIDLHIHVLTHDPQPNGIHTMTSLLTLISLPDDPRVAAALEEIAAGKHGLEMQRLLEEQRAMRQMRQQAPPFQSPGTAPQPFPNFPR